MANAPRIRCASPDDAFQEERLTVLKDVTCVVCSNRPTLFHRHMRRNVGLLSDLGMKHLLVYDGAANPNVERAFKDLQYLGITIISAGRHRGLSWCRNAALDACTTSRLVFLDDEVSVDRRSMVALGAALDHNDAVGVVIRGPELGPAFPWFVGPGQLHYLGIHDPLDSSKRPWGACLGIRADRARLWGLRFREELGRSKSALASGDDTQFCEDIRCRGGSVVLLEAAHVWHNIDSRRLSLAYLVRRAYWQGRSEVRRDNALPGFHKEWRRNLRSVTQSPWTAPIALALILAVAVGIGVEFLLRRV